MHTHVCELYIGACTLCVLHMCIGVRSVWYVCDVYVYGGKRYVWLCVVGMGCVVVCVVVCCMAVCLVVCVECGVCVCCVAVWGWMGTCSQRQAGPSSANFGRGGAAPATEGFPWVASPAVPTTKSLSCSN